jgi:hypothetical protein
VFIVKGLEGISAVSCFSIGSFESLVPIATSQEVFSCPGDFAILKNQNPKKYYLYRNFTNKHLLVFDVLFYKSGEGMFQFHRLIIIHYQDYALSF